MTTIWLEPDNIWIVKQLFSKEECENWIEYSESIGFQTAEVPLTAKEIRTSPHQRIFNTKVTVDSTILANEIWYRIEPFIPQTVDHIKKLEEHVPLEEYQNYSKHSINERIRFYKYTNNGQMLTKHYDGNFVRVVREANQKVVEHSFLTMIVYLNDCEHGGHTTFYDNQNTDLILHAVKPQTGDVLFFSHYYLHEGSPVTHSSAQKYVMRSDVLFRKPL